VARKGGNAATTLAAVRADAPGVIFVIIITDPPPKTAETRRRPEHNINDNITLREVAHTSFMYIYVYGSR